MCIQILEFLDRPLRDWIPSDSPNRSGTPDWFLFGVIFQRGRFCMFTAFRELVVSRDYTPFRTFMLAVAVQSVLIHAGTSLGWLEVWVIPFYWRAAVVGGFVFGAGMALAGGCSSGTWYRVGEGMVGSTIALLGFGLSAASTVWGILRPFRVWLQGMEVVINGEVPTLVNLLSLSPWVFVGLGVLAMAIWVIRAPRETPLFGWGWL